MHFKRLLFFSCFALIFAFLPIKADAQSKLSPELRQELIQNGQADYLMIYDGEADLAGAAAVTGLTARRQFVYDRLRQQASRSQAQALALLQGSGAVFYQHYLLNALEVTSDLGTAQRMAALPGVGRLAAVKPVRADLPQPVPGSQRDTENPAAPASVEWGVNRVHAPGRVEHL